MTSQPLGIALTAAGKVFLDHARLALAQVEAGCGSRSAGGSPPQERTVGPGFYQRVRTVMVACSDARSRENYPGSKSPSRAAFPRAGSDVSLTENWTRLPEGRRRYHPYSSIKDSAQANHFIVVLPSIIVSRRSRRRPQDLSARRSSHARIKPPVLRSVIEALFDGRHRPEPRTGSEYCSMGGYHVVASIGV